MLNADYKDIVGFKPHTYEIIYIIGFLGNIKPQLTNTHALRVLHWIGSDILGIMNLKDDAKAGVIDWLHNNIDVHLCEFEHTQKELASLGIKARIVPLPPKNIFQEEPLPEKFTVGVYDP